MPPVIFILPQKPHGIAALPTHRSPHILKQVGTKWQNWALMGSTVLFTFVLFPLKESYKRMDVDEAEEAEGARKGIKGSINIDTEAYT